MTLKNIITTTLLFGAPIFSFSQIDAELTDRSNNIVEIGKIKNLSSKEIKESKLSIGFECLDRKVFDPSKVYDKIATTGVKHARCQTGWARTETKKGVYDFKWLDDVVDNLRARGIQPWFNVGYGNPIYMGATDNPTAVGHVPLYYGDECLQAWKNYIRALATHFKGRVFEYEIWNESNHIKFWQPKKADASEYARLIKITAEEIKKADPDAKIGACKAGDFDGFFKKLLDSDGVECMDFFSFHNYSRMPEVGFPRGVKAANKLIKEKGLKIKMYQGESGHPAYIPKGCWVDSGVWYPSNESIQAKWMLRRYITDLSLGLEKSSFFMVIDFNSNYKVAGNKGYDEAVWGIMENAPSYRTRKAFDVLKNFCAIFDEDTKPASFIFTLNFDEIYPKKARVSRLPILAAQSANKTFVRNGYPLYVYYMPEDLQCRINMIEGLRIYTGSDTPKPLKKAVLIDMMTGKVYKLTKGLNNLPITDYPLILTDLDAITNRFTKK